MFQKREHKRRDNTMAVKRSFGIVSTLQPGGKKAELRNT
jgi:hypothetical protein